MRFIHLFAVGCLIIATTGFSQENGSTKITVFKPEDSKPTSTGALHPSADLHCLKWNYSVLSRGMFLVNYEFTLQKKLTAEVGLGLTYRDFLFEATHNNSFDNSSLVGKYNFGGEAGIRFYPRDHDNFEGVYLSPMISYRKYSLTTSTDMYSNIQYVNTISSFTPGYNLLDLQLKFGYQYESIWDWDLLSDFYVGVAIRNATVNYYETVQNPTTGGTEHVSTQKKIQFPQFLFGFKFCVPF